MEGRIMAYFDAAQRLEAVRVVRERERAGRDVTCGNE